MKSCMLITATLLCSLGWKSVFGSESHTVDVQSGKEVTLTCPNTSKTATMTNWFRVVNGTKPSCISSMFESSTKATFCDGFNDGRFEMSSNVSTVSLQIKKLDASDSGLYFCGFYIGKCTVIASATHMNVHEEPDEMPNLLIAILGALTALLSLIIAVLAVKIKKIQTDVNGELKEVRNKAHASEDLNYAAVSFQKKPKRASRPALDREMEPHVVYAATR